MSEKITDIEEYFASLPEEVLPTMLEIRRVIKLAAPEASERFSWGMPTYTLRENLVHFALFKKHIGFFPGSAAVEEFADKLKGLYTAKGTIRFSLDKPIPYDLIAEITQSRVEAVKADK